MKISVEISLYPLSEDYESIILAFLARLNQHPNLIIETNGMSTQVFGEYDQVMGAINQEMKKVYESGKAMLVLKMGQGTLRG